MEYDVNNYILRSDRFVIVITRSVVRRIIKANIIIMHISDKVHKASERAMDCGLGLGGLNQIYGPNHPTPFA